MRATWDRIAVVAAVAFLLSAGLVWPSEAGAGLRSPDPAVYVVTCGIEQGTAWQFSPGLYLTAAHVVTACGKASIELGDSTASAHVIRRNLHYDVAELKSSYVASLYIPLATRASTPGSPVKVRSAPGGKLETTSGVVLSDDAGIVIPQILASAQVALGSSGGVMVNQSGEAVGLVQEETLSGPHECLAIRQPLLSKFIDGELPGDTVGPLASSSREDSGMPVIVWLVLGAVAGAMITMSVVSWRSRRTPRGVKKIDSVDVVLGAVFRNEED